VEEVKVTYPDSRGEDDVLSTRIKVPKEITEYLEPEAELAQPVLGPITYIRAEKWRINRVFAFLAFSTLVCLGAVIISPVLPVQIVALSVWSGAVGLSRYLLRSAYGQKTKKM
jgi:hypothetical protein